VRSQTKLISIHLIYAAVVVKSTRGLRVMRERGHIQIGYPSPHLSEYFAEYDSLQILMLFCIASPACFRSLASSRGFTADGRITLARSGGSTVV